MRLRIALSFLLAAMLSGSAHAAITQVSYTTKADASNTESHTINKPSDVQDGDVLVAWFTLTWSEATVTDPEGWTRDRVQNTTAGTDMWSGVFHKVVADADSEPSTYTWTSSGSLKAAMQMICLRGVDTSTPIDATTVYTSGTNWNDNGSCPTITTATNGALVFPVFCITGAPTGPTAPSGATLTSAGLVTAVYSHVAAYYTQATAGATGTKLFDFETNNTDWEWHGYQIAFRPAATGLSVQRKWWHHRRS